MNRLWPIQLVVLATAATYVSCGSDPSEPITPPPSHNLVADWEEPEIPAAVVDIRGFSDNNVYAIGGSGLLLHYNGATWAKMKSPTHEHMSAMWALSTSNIVAVGLNGTILRCDGSEWRAETAATTKYLSDVWGSASDTLFAVGDGIMLSYDGEKWKSIDPPASAFLRRIWGTSASDMYVGSDDSLYHYDGVKWRNTDITVRESVWGISGSSPRDVWVSDGTNWLWHYNGLTWTNVITQVGYPFTDLWALGPNDVLGVGTDGFVSHFDGVTWSEQSLGDYFLIRTWGASASNAWAVGVYTRGTIGALFHFDGAEWASMSEVTVGGVTDIWSNRSGSRATAVGYEGVIFQKENGSWNAIAPFTDEDLNAVWESPSGRAIAVGANGTCLQRDGQVWQPIDLGTTDNLHDVWGFADSDIYVASDHGVIHYDGVEWQPSGFNSFINSVWGSSAHNVFAAGADSTYESGIVRRFDGAKWTTIYSGPLDLVSSLTGNANGEIFAVFYNRDTTTNSIQKYAGSTWSDIPTLPAPSVSALTFASNLGLVLVAHEWSGPVVSGVYRLRNEAWEPIDLQYDHWFVSAFGGLDDGVYLAGGPAIARCHH